MKPLGDHARLVRAFEVPPTNKSLVALTTGGAALVGLVAPAALLVAGGIAVGAGGLAIGDRRAVQRGLREVEAWGFPVVGYRGWLLAETPTFDIELAREVDLDVLASSARAVDSSLVLARTGERTFRVVSRRVALPAPRKDGPVVLVGDRQLLAELHARVLAPLHADVGIRVMRMGDATSLADAPANVPPADDPRGGTGAGAFREQAMAAPPALQALVQVGGGRELPHEAREVANRAERVVYAVGSAPHGGGTVIAFTIGGVSTGAGWFGLTGMAVGATAGLLGGIAAAIQGNRRNARQIAGSVAGQGFPIEGYDDWLISGRPIFDIELRSAIDRGWLDARLARLPRAWSVSANAEVSWIEEVQWLDDRHVRIETRPTLIEPASRVPPFYGGSHPMFQTFVSEVVAPLHAHAGIAAIRMGGYLTRRV